MMLPIVLSLKEAKVITGGLSKPSKMPGYGYGLDARRCVTGAKLAAEDPSSICASCYALKGRYMFPAVRQAHANRHEGLSHPLWVQAMATLINHYSAPSGVFRWHDSGDIQSPEHLAQIAEVARLTPTIKHWLPTREYGMVAEYLKDKELPANLTVRLSAFRVDEAPKLPKEVSHLPTSTVHTIEPIQLTGRRKDTVECKAPSRGNECGPCRACWSPKVKNVSYGAH